MTSEEFNDAAELYDALAMYDREAMVAIVGHLVMHLVENGTLNKKDFLARLGRDIAANPDTDDQVSRRLAELATFLSGPEH